MTGTPLGPWRLSALVALSVGLILWVILTDPTLETWRTVTLGTVAVGQMSFCALYATFPWYKSFLGRALFYKAMVLGLITSLFLITRIFGFTNVDEMFTVFYGFLALGVWLQFFAFLRVRKEGKATRAVQLDTDLSVDHNRRSSDA